MRKYLTRILVSIAPVLFALVCIGFAYWNYQYEPDTKGLRFNLGTDLAGGSVLLYELDESKFPTKEVTLADGTKKMVPRRWRELSQNERDGMAAERLVPPLKKRIDPNNLKEISIRPVPAEPPQVEFILPYRRTAGGAKAAGSDIEDVKRLITTVGNLEFRMQAYRSQGAPRSDHVAMAAIKAAYDPTTPEKLPMDTSFADNYEWIELDAREAQLCGFENDNKRNPPRTGHFTPGYQELTMDRGTYAYFHIPTKDRQEGQPAGRHYTLTRRPTEETRVTGAELFNCYPTIQNNKYVVAFSVRDYAQGRFYELTDNKGYKMAILYENKVVSAPNLNDRLSTGGIITMGSSGAEGKREVDDLVLILNAGALPGALNPNPVSEDTMEPTLGQSTIRSGLIAIVAAYLAVILFMCWYYNWAGVVASIALFSNLLLTVGFMVFVNAAFTLPGLAGLVLMLGMAIDSNVLIYERLREERERGASLALALRNAYDRALPTILDTHLTSIFTAVVLYAVGTDQLKGFGISLAVGLIISLFTTLHTARLLLEMSVGLNWISDFRMRQLFARPNIDFMRVRNYWFAATLILSLFGLVIFLVRGERGLSIDFRGGTEYSFVFQKDHVDENYVRKELEKAHLPDPAINALGSKGNEFVVSTKMEFENLTAKEQQEYGITTQEEFDFKRGAIPNIVRDRVRDAFPGQLRFVRVQDLAFGANSSVRKIELPYLMAVTFQEKKFSPTEMRTFMEGQLSPLKLTQPLDSYFHVEGQGQPDEYGKYTKFHVEYKVPDAEGVESHQAFKDQLTASLKKTFEEPVSNRKRNIGSSWAAGAQEKATMAILLSWLVIVGYLWFRFGNWTFGVAAVLCLVHDLMFTIGLIGLSHYLATWGIGQYLLIDDFKIDFTAVAALLTLVGYSVNDTIVVFDRIREVRGKNPLLTAQMINDSVNQTLSRTVLASLTTFLVVFVLFIAGGESIHLFSFVMVVGVVIGTYSSIFVASPLLLIFKEGAEVQTVSSRRQPQPATV
jgi:SecD/SecF fusion protein